MAGYKIGRITSDIQNALSVILREVKDPRVSPLLSIVKIDLSNDLSYAKVYVSAIEGSNKTKESVAGLKSASGYIRKALASSLHLRKVPELKFIEDDSLIKSADIMNTIKSFDHGNKENE